MLLPHNLYSGAKHIPLFSQRPFHFHSSVGTLFIATKGRFHKRFCALMPNFCTLRPTFEKLFTGANVGTGRERSAQGAKQLMKSTLDKHNKSNLNLLGVQGRKLNAIFPTIVLLMAITIAPWILISFCSSHIAAWMVRFFFQFVGL